MSQIRKPPGVSGSQLPGTPGLSQPAENPPASPLPTAPAQTPTPLRLSIPDSYGGRPIPAAARTLLEQGWQLQSDLAEAWKVDSTLLNAARKLALEAALPNHRVGRQREEAKLFRNIRSGSGGAVQLMLVSPLLVEDVRQQLGTSAPEDRMTESALKAELGLADRDYGAFTKFIVAVDGAWPGQLHRKTSGGMAGKSLLEAFVPRSLLQRIPEYRQWVTKHVGSPPQADWSPREEVLRTRNLTARAQEVETWLVRELGTASRETCAVLTSNCSWEARRFYSPTAVAHLKFHPEVTTWVSELTQDAETVRVAGQALQEARILSAEDLRHLDQPVIAIIRGTALPLMERALGMPPRVWANDPDAAVRLETEQGKNCHPPEMFWSAVQVDLPPVEVRAALHEMGGRQISAYVTLVPGANGPQVLIHEALLDRIASALERTQLRERKLTALPLESLVGVVPERMQEEFQRFVRTRTADAGKVLTRVGGEEQIERSWAGALFADFTTMHAADPKLWMPLDAFKGSFPEHRIAEAAWDFAQDFPFHVWRRTDGSVGWVLRSHQIDFQYGIRRL